MSLIRLIDSYITWYQYVRELPWSLSEFQFTNPVFAMCKIFAPLPLWLVTTANWTLHVKCAKNHGQFSRSVLLCKKWPNQAFFQKTFEKANERYTFQSIRLFYYSKCFLSILIAPRSLIKFHSAKVNWCEMDLRSQINAGISLDLC